MNPFEQLSHMCSQDVVISFKIMFSNKKIYIRLRCASNNEQKTQKLIKKSGFLFLNLYLSK